jgi:transcriptional regulator with XRE-family HTH domain
MKKTIGERLKNFRASLGLSTEEIARIIGGNQSAFSKNENDKTKPSADTLIALYEKFQIDPLWLLTGEKRNTQIESQTSLQIAMLTDKLDEKSRIRILEQIKREVLLEEILRDQKTQKASCE